MLDVNLKMPGLTKYWRTFFNLALIGQEILREFVEGTEPNVTADTALHYVMEGKFVERYRTEMSQRRQKIKLLLVVVV